MSNVGCMLNLSELMKLRESDTVFYVDGIVGVEREHLNAFVYNDKLCVQPDNYINKTDAGWDIEKYESRMCCLYAPPTRKNWLLLYRFGRCLANGRKVFVRGEDASLIELKCDGSEYHLL